MEDVLPPEENSGTFDIIDALLNEAGTSIENLQNETNSVELLSGPNLPTEFHLEVTTPNSENSLENENSNDLDFSSDADNQEEGTQEVTDEDSSIESEAAPELIPVNSTVLEINEFTSRFNGAVWMEKMQNIDLVLAGVGGIGSWTGLLLSRFNPGTMTIYDDDTIEASNISGQFYNIIDNGDKKVHSLMRAMTRYSGYFNCNSIGSFFTEDSRTEKVMICGFDNMKARKTFYNAWKDRVTNDSILEDFNPKEYLFIDGRLSAEEFQIFCIRGDDSYYMEKYEQEYLFSDEEAEPTLCSYKQTSFMSNMIAGFISNLFVNFVTNLCDVPLERELPFITSYQAEYLILKITK